MKIKLKDITEKQYTTFRQFQCSSKCKSCPLNLVECDSNFENCWIYNKGLYNKEFLNKYLELEPSIFNKEEKKYLHNLLKSYKRKIEKYGLRK